MMIMMVVNHWKKNIEKVIKKYNNFKLLYKNLEVNNQLFKNYNLFNRQINLIL